MAAVEAGDPHGAEAAPARRLQGTKHKAPLSTAHSGPLAGSQEEAGNMQASDRKERQSHGQQLQTKADVDHEHNLIYDHDTAQGANITEGVSQRSDRPERQFSSSREHFSGADQEPTVGTAEAGGGSSENGDTLEPDTKHVSQQGQVPGAQQHMPEASRQHEAMTGDTSSTLLPGGHVAGSQPMAQQNEATTGDTSSTLVPEGPDAATLSEASKVHEVTGDTSSTLLPEGHDPGSQPMAQQHEARGDTSSALLQEGHDAASQPMVLPQAASDELASDPAVPTQQEQHAAQPVGNTAESFENQASLVQQTKEAEEPGAATTGAASHTQQTESIPLETVQQEQQAQPVESGTPGDLPPVTEHQGGDDVSDHDRVQDASAQQQQRQRDEL